MPDQWTIMQVIVTAVPVAIGAIAISIGSKQVREFHERTGDDSVLSHIAGLSAFHQDEKTVAKVPKAARRRKDDAGHKTTPAVTSIP